MLRSAISDVIDGTVLKVKWAPVSYTSSLQRDIVLTDQFQTGRY